MLAFSTIMGTVVDVIAIFSEELGRCIEKPPTLDFLSLINFRDLAIEHLLMLI
jgi:hypothetical protein